MKNKNIMNRIIIFFAFFLITGTCFSQIKTEEDLAKAVFETLKNSDSEAFSAYCISEKRVTKLLEELVDTTHMVKSVKADLAEINPQDMKNEVIAGFDKLLNTVKEENLDISKATFEMITQNKIRMDIPKLMAKKVKFRILIETRYYFVGIDFFKTNTDMFLYDLSFEKGTFK